MALLTVYFLLSVGSWLLYQVENCRKSGCCIVMAHSKFPHLCLAQPKTLKTTTDLLFDGHSLLSTEGSWSKVLALAMAKVRKLAVTTKITYHESYCIE